MQKPLCVECQREADALDPNGFCSDKCGEMFGSSVESAMTHAMSEAVTEMWMAAHFHNTPPSNWV